MDRKKLLKDTKRIVLKIGTNSIIFNHKNIDMKFLRSIAKQVIDLNKQGIEVIIITSGAIGVGRKELNLKKLIKTIEMSQIASSIGQPLLMIKYRNVFAKYNRKVAQILVMYLALEDKKTLIRMNGTIKKMLKMGIIPIINENDAMAIDEIGRNFGDNDNLSAIIATKIKADLLVQLTTVHGFYQNQEARGNKKYLSEITKITSELDRMCKGKSKFGKGGMKTKLIAAELCMRKGTHMIITHRSIKNVLPRIIKGEEIGTMFVSKRA